MDQEWSKFIRNKDGNKCRVCNSKEQLTAHHLYSKSKYPQFMYHKWNGLTLCESCHRKFHKIYGSDNTPQQFVLWCLTFQIPRKKFQKIMNLCLQMAIAKGVSTFVAKNEIAATKDDSKKSGDFLEFNQHIHNLRRVVIRVPGSLIKDIQIEVISK
ncbi:HNH endonuclease [Hazenella coriacea]|uniref:HNH endonuclease n=1 Tax=Hazenella coriacea TaxID=1179467 RepID=A0A4R3L5A9_9BACL|nr:HNH endonuclease [Hazenella coriacea]TCS94981.1 hypothetical protein EDD58_103406 [Hazenella coriacea]